MIRSILVKSYAINKIDAKTRDQNKKTLILI